MGSKAATSVPITADAGLQKLLSVAYGQALLACSLGSSDHVPGNTPSPVLVINPDSGQSHLALRLPIQLAL